MLQNHKFIQKKNRKPFGIPFLTNLFISITELIYYRENTRLVFACWCNIYCHRVSYQTRNTPTRLMYILIQEIILIKERLQISPSNITISRAAYHLQITPPQHIPTHYSICSSSSSSRFSGQKKEAIKVLLRSNLSLSDFVIIIVIIFILYYHCHYYCKMLRDIAYIRVRRPLSPS